MTVADDLRQIIRNPGTVSRRRLVAALHQAGYSLERHGSRHDVYRKEGAPVLPVPHHLKGTGTIRRIARQALDSLEADR